ncbi:MAG: ABA4-like family protein [Acidobacteria bacterium]|nr:ABA4-like family protein [Acidobacteriota bacterium]
MAVNLGVLPAWLLLLIAPGWRWSQRIASTIMPSLLGLVYLYLFFRQFRTLGGSFATLALTRIMFAEPGVVLAGWIHFLAFDLIVAAWVAQDAHRRHLPRMVMVPCLLVTLAAAPLGLLLYRGLRWARFSQVWEAE